MSEQPRRTRRRRAESDTQQHENPLVNELERLKENFSGTADKIIKDIKRQERIMARSDKRQRKEYDELQQRLIEVQGLQEAQKKLLDSFIELIAGAIDAKSKYTGGHCNRVPILANMLGKAASESGEGIFEDFQLSERDAHELNIAAWLHDCGKVVTPEYVVDKATKLETIYNRIHEIRNRFEIIHRDLTIESLQRIIAGEEKASVEQWLAEEHAKLQEEFAFIAKANVGGEFMRDEDQQRVRDIGKREWTRYFDDRLGLSSEELRLIGDEAAETPARETLLADKPRHIIPREHFDYDEYERMGFKMPVPDALYNRGEIFNLTIAKGTLTYEERFKINEHMVMTIKMLEQLPFPDHLKNVPLYAGAHHETMIGTGYPRQLTKDDMPIPSRIMAIADVFEALTAADRPYKDAKTLSMSIKIMSFMVKDQHLDRDIFELFLKSGVYKQYAEAYLKPEQIDEVDIDQYLS